MRPYESLRNDSRAGTRAPYEVGTVEQTTDKSELISLEDLRGALAEFVATLLFVFMGVGAVVASGSLVGGDLTPARLVVIAMGHGLAIALLVFAIGHISGGYINPAVTFAAVVTRKISVPKGIVFVVAQLSGALIGAVLVSWVVPDAIEGTLGAHGLAPGVSAGMGVVIELVLTFLLVFVVFATAIDPRGGAGNLAPLAIGFAVLVGTLAAGPFTGASINPARSFGPAVVALEWADHWVYWVGPLAGAALAGLVYQLAFLNREPQSGV